MGTIINFDFASACHAGCGDHTGSTSLVTFKGPRRQKGAVAAEVPEHEVQRALQPGMIAPAVDSSSCAAIVEHASEPIKKMEDIAAISDWFITRKRYRDNMLFIVGINFGLRVSDLLTLRFCDLINDDLKFKDTFPILERKTSNTRKVKRNRYITINDAVVSAVTLYLKNTPDVKLSDYMFRGESNRCGHANKPMHRNSVERVLKEVCDQLGLGIHVATHTLRKTFAYHQMLISNNDPRKLLLLQKMFGHSTSAQTLEYIGITGEEIRAAYMQINLGMGAPADHNVRAEVCLMDSVLNDGDVAAL